MNFSNQPGNDQLPITVAGIMISGHGTCYSAAGGRSTDAVSIVADHDDSGMSGMSMAAIRTREKAAMIDRRLGLVYE